MDLPRFWLVDPLEGAFAGKSGNGEFTVNIALVEGDTPVLGAVYVPVSKTLYFAARGDGCWKIHDGGERQQLKVSTPSIGRRHVLW